MLRSLTLIAGSVLLSLTAGPLAAGEAEVVDATVSMTAPGVYRFSVTVRHADAGWEHYADRWEVLLPNRSVAARRTLLHPHVEEQPFTRSLGDVRIPQGVQQVTLRAHDSVHGYGGREMLLELPR